MIVHHTRRRGLVRSSRSTSANNVIHVVPSTHLFEQFILRALLLLVTTAADLRPRAAPHGFLSIVRGIGVASPFPDISIVLGITGVLARFGVDTDGILLFASSHERPRVGALSTGDLIPATTMNREGLFQVADPQFTIFTGLACEQLQLSTTRGRGAQALIDFVVFGKCQ